jgi:single-stranded-DNA-specific exonuclease
MFKHGPSLKELSQSQPTNLTPLQLLIAESILSEFDHPIESLFDFRLENLPSPFLLPDLLAAVVLLRKFVYEGKKILLYGDRDTDGVSSTSLLALFLKQRLKDPQLLEVKTSSEKDDYGLCPTVIERILKVHPDLLITLDFGTSNYDEINFLSKKGIQIVVLDHHEIPTRIPNCLLINPRREDSLYPEKKICTAVLAFKLVQAYLLIEAYELENNKNLFPCFDIDFYKNLDYLGLLKSHPKILEKSHQILDLASIGTITDLMPLVSENRVIVFNGCNSILNTLKSPTPDRIGLHVLLKNLSLNTEKITSKDLGWSIGPVLNAAGRMGKTETALSLLLSENEEEASKLVQEILELNKERKERTKRNLFRVDGYFSRKKEREERSIIFCYEPDMEPGVSGIVASKLVEVYKKPVVFVTPEHGKARGSVRTFGNENVIELFEMISDLLIQHGGHPEAGGFSIELDKIPLLEARLIEIGERWVKTSSKGNFTQSLVSLSPEELTAELYQEISLLEPFGHANPVPILSIKDAELVSFKILGDGNHARFCILKSSPKIKGLVWNRGKELFELLSKKSKIDLWGNLEENYFNGTTSLQFSVIHFE